MSGRPLQRALLDVDAEDRGAGDMLGQRDRAAADAAAPIQHLSAGRRVPRQHARDLGRPAG